MSPSTATASAGCSALQQQQQQHSASACKDLLSRELDLQALRQAYASGYSPSALVRALYPDLQSAQSSKSIFIHLSSLSELLEAARCLEAMPQEERESKPLWGVPFAVKDNVDVAGCPTTAACPSFSRTPIATAPAVQAVLDAGEAGGFFSQEGQAYPCWKPSSSCPYWATHRLHFTP